MIDAKGGMCCWLAAVCHSFLNSHAQRRNNKKKKLDVLMVNIKLAPRNSTSLISRKYPKNNDGPFPSVLFSLLTSVWGLKGER